MRSNTDRPDLSNCSVRRNLKTIYAKRRRQRTPKPYWNFLAHGRHLGYLKQNATRTWWVARYRTKGGPGLGFYHERRLGRTDDKHKANGRDILSYDQAATLAWSWFLSEAKSAGDVRPLGAFEPSYCPVGSVYTIAHAVNDWLAWTRIASSQKTVFNNISRINTHILPRLGTLAIEEFNGEHFGKFVLDVIETPVARGYRKPTPRMPMEQLDSETLRKRRKTANKLIGILRRSLQMAWENGKTNNDRTWRAVRYLPTYDAPRTLYLTRAECRTLLEHCGPELKLLVLGALYTGCRVTELIRLKARDVGRGGYGVSVNLSKNYRPRFVFLPDEGMNFFLNLAKNKRRQDFIFTRCGGKPWDLRYRYHLKKAILAADLPEDFCFHDLRHTYASQLIQAGAPLKVVADQLGHINELSVSQTYGHLAPQMRESEVRQRFTVLSPENARKAARQKKALTEWRNSLQGSNWRTYATISDLSSRFRQERVTRKFIAYSRARDPVGEPTTIKPKPWRYGPG